MKRFIKYVVYFIFLCIIGLISGHLTFELLRYGRIVIMPDLFGKDLSEAERLLSSYRLHLRVDGDDYDNHVPHGHIIKQDIPPGNKLKEGREIGVILSKGPRIKDVPNLVGMSLNEADAILKSTGLRINKIIYVHSSFAEKNTIIAQRPEPHESGGNLFSIIVSLGDFTEEENK